MTALIPLHDPATVAAALATWPPSQPPLNVSALSLEGVDPSEPGEVS